MHKHVKTAAISVAGISCLLYAVPVMMSLIPDLSDARAPIRSFATQELASPTSLVSEPSVTTPTAYAGGGAASSLPVVTSPVVSEPVVTTPVKTNTYTTPTLLDFDAPLPVITKPVYTAPVVTTPVVKTTVLDPEYDLAISKGYTGDEVSNHNFYISVVNNGPGVAPASYMSDFLARSGLEFVRSVSNSLSCSLSNGVYGCHIPSLQPRESRTIIIQVKPINTQATGFCNSVHLTGGLDLNMSNNEATACAYIRPIEPTGSGCVTLENITQNNTQYVTAGQRNVTLYEGTLKNRCNIDYAIIANGFDVSSHLGSILFDVNSGTSASLYIDDDRAAMTYFNGTHGGSYSFDPYQKLLPNSYRKIKIIIDQLRPNIEGSVDIIFNKSYPSFIGTRDGRGILIREISNNALSNIKGSLFNTKLIVKKSPKTDLPASDNPVKTQAPTTPVPVKTPTKPVPTATEIKTNVVQKSTTPQTCLILKNETQNKTLKVTGGMRNINLYKGKITNICNYDIAVEGFTFDAASPGNNTNWIGSKATLFRNGQNEDTDTLDSVDDEIQFADAFVVEASSSQNIKVNINIPKGIPKNETNTFSMVGMNVSDLLDTDQTIVNFSTVAIKLQVKK